MRRNMKGSMTVFLALTAMCFLLLCLVLTEGARIYYLRVKAAQAMELSEFSVLSEYQKELWDHYGLFFLDLGYEQGEEKQEILNGRILHYLRENVPEVTTTYLAASDFIRSTDRGGIPFAKQAVEHMKKRSGAALIEQISSLDASTEASVDLEDIFGENQEAAEGIVGAMVDEEGKPLFDIALPDISFPTVESLSHAVFGDTSVLSGKSISKEERILYRTLEEGTGGKEGISLIDMQFFYSYLFRYLNDYCETDSGIWKDRLEYQLEYVIAGKENDRENLENIMWRIFLLRAVGDYLFFHQDAEKIAAAQAQATAIGGITGNGVLISLLQEMILIAEAVDQGISETKQVFLGEKVPLYENGAFAGITIGYEEYLYLFLNTASGSECICRAMDVIELEIRQKAEYEAFRMDYCVEAFEVEWTYGYEGIFRKPGLSEEGTYGTTILQKMQYEM